MITVAETGPTAKAAPPKRWELYRLLGEPLRLRLLALAGEEELAIGELADLLGESQPNVSRHVAPLRRAGLLAVRKQGTRALVRLDPSKVEDAVVADALAAGRGLCTGDGSFARIAEVLSARDRATREYFARADGSTGEVEWPSELPAYLALLAPLLDRRRLAIDVGTGDGSLLDVLAPIFDHVIGIDRAEARLDQARSRIRRRGYDNVTLLATDYDAPTVADAVRQHGGGLADAVFASRVLHHSPRPQATVATWARLLRPSGVLAILDYVDHHDEALRERHADQWLGFALDELPALLGRAGLAASEPMLISRSARGAGPDSHLEWQVVVGRAHGGGDPAP